MSDFLKELEEDIHEERLLNLWYKYGNYVIGLAVTIVIGTVIYVIWQHVAQNRREQRYLAFSQALKLKTQGKTAEATKAFHTLTQERGGYSKLSQLYEASFLSHPIPLYTKISQENPADPALSKLPKLLIAARSLDKPETLKTLEPLAAPNNAWAPLSLELMALEHLKQGDRVKAAKLYTQMLQETSLSPHEQLRAEMMLAQLDVPSSLTEEKGATENK